MEEDKIYVAISKEFKASKSTLLWALQNSGGKRVCILHVHQPDRRIPTPVGYLPPESVDKAQLKAHRLQERGEMAKILDEYLQISLRAGVSIEKVHTENGCIEEGIIQLIEQHKIGKLIMGAAADKYYHPRKMTDLRSKKAIYIRAHAPYSCHIWFVCNGYLIHTRKATRTESLNASQNEAATNLVEGNEAAANHVEGNEVLATAPPFSGPEWILQRWSIGTDGSGPVSTPSSGRESVEISGTESIAGSSGSKLLAIHHSFASRNEAAQGTGLQDLYIEECKRRKQVEAELAKVKVELEWMKSHVAPELPKVNEELDYMRNQVAELAKVKAELEFMKNDVLGELRSAIEQKALLENQIGNFTFLLQMLGEKLASSFKLVHKYGEQ